MITTVAWGGELLLLTELLSAFHLLNYPGVVTGWFVTLTASVLFYLFSPALPQKTTPPTTGTDKCYRFTLTGVTIVAVITALTALLAAPNNFDSQTYHLGRMVHWLQNQSVDHYPTNIIRQLYLPPLAEYALLHMQILTGSDYLFNLLQWSAMVGCLVAVAMIARLLGGEQRAIFMAVALSATIPMGILQSSSTQNDYLTAFWVACFAWSSLLPRQKPLGWESLVMAASLGLAIITKGTAYPLAFPFLVWVFLKDLRIGPVRAIKQLLVVTLMVMAINGSHYWRNWQTFGNPLSIAGENFTNENPGLGTMALNMGRNMVMQFATPFRAVNSALESAVASAGRQVGIDPTDSRTTFTPFGLRTFMQLHEDFAINPLHTLMIMITIILVASRRFLRSDRLLRNYALACLSSFALFSLILKWQPFGSRLLLPLLVLWAPACGTVISKIRSGRLVAPLIAFCFACSLPWLLANSSRPLLTPPATLAARLLPGIIPPRTILASGRIEQYYANKPEYRRSQEAAVTELGRRGCSVVGLQVGGDYWEYTLWVQMKQQGTQLPLLEHVGVRNSSAPEKEPAIRPECRIIAGQDNITYLAAQHDIMPAAVIP